jgi:hypothetical protein
MLDQNNISSCLLLLQQQVSLQNDLNKYCSLIAVFDLVLGPLNLSNNGNSINPDLDYVVAALTDAKSTNKSIINNLQLLVELSAVSGKTSKY